MCAGTKRTFHSRLRRTLERSRRAQHPRNRQDGEHLCSPVSYQPSESSPRRLLSEDPNLPASSLLLCDEEALFASASPLLPQHPSKTHQTTAARHLIAEGQGGRLLPPRAPSAAADINSLCTHCSGRDSKFTTRTPILYLPERTKENLSQGTLKTFVVLN